MASSCELQPKNISSTTFHFMGIMHDIHISFLSLRNILTTLILLINLLHYKFQYLNKLDYYPLGLLFILAQCKKTFINYLTPIGLCHLLANLQFLELSSIFMDELLCYQLTCFPLNYSIFGTYGIKSIDSHYVLLIQSS